MIKSWIQFKESIHFDNSPEFKEIEKKYSLKKEDIMDSIQEMEDDRNIECEELNSYISQHNLKENKIKIITRLSLKKLYKVDTKELDQYQSLLKEQIDDIDMIISTCKRLCHIEDMEILKTITNQLPSQGAGNNIKEFGKLSIMIVFSKIIQTDEISKANDDFLKKDNPERKAYNTVIETLIKNGVKKEDVRSLVDYQLIDDYLAFGLLTNDGILQIATYYDGILDFEDNDFLLAIDRYESGQCNEYL